MPSTQLHATWTMRCDASRSCISHIAFAALHKSSDDLTISWSLESYLYSECHNNQVLSLESCDRW